MNMDNGGRSDDGVCDVVIDCSFMLSCVGGLPAKCRLEILRMPIAVANGEPDPSDGRARVISSQSEPVAGNRSLVAFDPVATVPRGQNNEMIVVLRAFEKRMGLSRLNDNDITDIKLNALLLDS